MLEARRLKYGKKLIAALILLVFLGFFVFYSFYSNAKKAITTYNYLLAQAYGALDPYLIEPVASRREVRRLSIVMSNYRFYKKHPLMELKSLDFVAFSWGLKKVEVVTRERWVFTTVDLSTRKVGSRYLYDYETLYILKRFGLSFIVNEVKVLEEKKRTL